jgi:hypothetical protein
MLQMLLANAIMMGLCTRKQADLVYNRLRSKGLPSTPGEVYDVIMQEIENAKNDQPSPVS